MVTKKYFSVYDKKAGIHSIVHEAINHVEAIRQLEIAAKQENTHIGMWPDEFELFYLGEFDVIQGKFMPLDKPEFICCARDLIKVGVSKSK